MLSLEYFVSDIVFDGASISYSYIFSDRRNPHETTYSYFGILSQPSQQQRHASFADAVERPGDSHTHGNRLISA